MWQVDVSKCKNEIARWFKRGNIVVCSLYSCFFRCLLCTKVTTLKKKKKKKRVLVHLDWTRLGRFEPKKKFLTSSCIVGFSKETDSLTPTLIVLQGPINKGELSHMFLGFNLSISHYVCG